MYIVYGGVFTDTTFKSLEPETPVESYGPFESYKEALNVWRGRMGWNVDNCMHRLFITKYDESNIGLPVRA
jgi:hypothetical protein